MLKIEGFEFDATWPSCDHLWTQTYCLSAPYNLMTTHGLTWTETSVINASRDQNNTLNLVFNVRSILFSFWKGIISNSCHLQIYSISLFSVLVIWSTVFQLKVEWPRFLCPPSSALVSQSSAYHVVLSDQAGDMPYFGLMANLFYLQFPCPCFLKHNFLILFCDYHFESASNASHMPQFLWHIPDLLQFDWWSLRDVGHLKISSTWSLRLTMSSEMGLWFGG